MGVWHSISHGDWPSVRVDILEDTKALPPPTTAPSPVFLVNPHHGPSHSGYPDQLLASDPAHPPPSASEGTSERNRRRRGRSYPQLPGRVKPETYLPNGHKAAGQ